MPTTADVLAILAGKYGSTSQQRIEVFLRNQPNTPATLERMKRDAVACERLMRPLYTAKKRRQRKKRLDAALLEPLPTAV